MRTFHSVVSMAAFLGACLLVMPIDAFSQNYNYVDVEGLEARPHLYWAKGIVFRDVMTEKPGRKTKRINDRDVHRFKTSALGDVYAEPEALVKFESLEVGQDYYFSGTIGQKGRKYFYIVNNVSAYTNDAEYLEELIANLNLENRTNQYNQVFLVLEQIMRDVHNDIFGYSTSEDIPINELIGNPMYRQQVASAVRTALRRFENLSKTSSQELFVSTIVSMMALQYGYADTSDPDAYQPGSLEEVSAGETPVQEDASEYDGMSAEEWDLSEEMVASAVDIDVPEAPEETVEAPVEDETKNESAYENVSEDGWNLSEEVIAPVADIGVPEIQAEEAKVSVEEVVENVPTVEPIEVIQEAQPVIDEAEVPVEKILPEADEEKLESVKEGIEEDITENQTEESIEMTDEADAEAVQDLPAAEEAAKVVETVSEEIEETAIDVEEAVEIEAPEVEVEEVPAVKEPVVEAGPDVIDQSFVPVPKPPVVKSEAPAEEIVPPKSEEKSPPAQEGIDYSSPLRLR